MNASYDEMKLRNLTILAANVLTQKIIAMALAKSMEDPSFRNSFESANPGLMDKLKALVAEGMADAAKNGVLGDSSSSNDSSDNEGSKAALLPSPEDLAANIDDAKSILDSNSALNSASALDLLNSGSLDPKEFISLSKDKLEETPPSEQFDADKQAVETIHEGMNNSNLTAKDTAIALITQDPMAVPVLEALQELLDKIDNLELATGIINAAVSDSAFVDNIVDSDLAKGLTLSTEEMRAAMLNAVKGGDEVVLQVVTEALLGADAIDEDEAAKIVSDILETNKNDNEIITNVSKEGSFNDKLENAFGSSSDVSLGVLSEGSAIQAINTASEQQIADAYLDACSNPDFLNAIQEYDENISQKMAEALANKLASLNGANSDADSLFDAFNQLSKEDLIKAIKATLDLDNLEATLSKTFDNTMVEVEGFNPEMSEHFLQQFNNESGIPPNDMVAHVIDALDDALTPDSGQRLVKSSKDALEFAIKEKLAECLAECMNDPAFREAFEQANPGLLDQLADKELLASMLKNMRDLDDLKNAKNMMAGQGEFDQEQQLDASIFDLLDRFLNDLDGLASDIVFKKTKEFEAKILEDHNSRKNKQLIGLSEQEDEDEETIPDKKGQSMQLDVKNPRQLEIAKEINKENTEILMNQELLKNLELALDVDELLVKGVKYNTVNPREVDDIKRDMLNK